MRFHRLILVAVMLLAPRLARAQNDTDDWVSRNPTLVSLGAFAAVTTDMTFTACALGHDRPDRKLATLEIIFTAPQVGVLVWQGTAASEDRTRLLLLAASAWPAALTLHGAWALWRGESEQRASSRANWGLTLVGPGTLGVGASGRF